jgi:uncharacterized cupin superfamily protein
MVGEVVEGSEQCSPVRAVAADPGSIPGGSGERTLAHTRIISLVPAAIRDGGAMHRLNFLADEPWDEVNGDDRMRVRWFGHPFGADILGASLRELLPGSPAGWLHMHYGVEEMFFVLAGTPTVRTPEGEEQLSPGDVVYFPEGPEGLHDFSNPTDEPVRLLAISSKRFPDVVAYPERGVAWVGTRHPERPVPEGGDNGIIARFDLPPSQ